MNKRARLARRILREHRQGTRMHRNLEFKMPGAGRVMGFWACPRCPKWELIPMEAPRAYR